MERTELEKAKKEIGEMIKNLNSTTACFTGHRIQKLPWRANEEDERCKVVKLSLYSEIEKAIIRGYNTFLCGMAIGFDTYCAETVLELKKIYPHIKLICAIPCKNQDIKWTKKDRERYRGLLKQADGIRCIYEEYAGAECMIERNRYMVNNSSLMITMFNGSPGGTSSTVKYAKEKGLEIIYIDGVK